MHVSDGKEEGQKVTRCANKGDVDILRLREGEAVISVPLRRLVVRAPSSLCLHGALWEKGLKRKMRQRR